MISMKLGLTSSEKKAVFSEVEKYLKDLGLEIVSRDSNRPWGGYFVIDEKQAHHFGNLFFPDENLSDKYIGTKLSPKVLLVQPKMRLSWQYHLRRSEIWKVVSGRVGVITSDTDKEGNLIMLNTGEIIRLAKGQRHRLIGLDGWGIIAEIWQHTDITNPSDEEDIVRVQDDFGR